MITTLLGEMDESKLILHEDLIDNENERTASVEYCVPGCSGQAHVTGNPDAVGYFCASHIHRSVNVLHKTGLEALGLTGVIGG